MNEHDYENCKYCQEFGQWLDKKLTLEDANDWFDTYEYIESLGVK